MAEWIDNKIGDSGAEIISETLKECDVWTELNLSRDEIKSFGKNSNMEGGKMNRMRNWRIGSKEDKWSNEI